MIRKSAAGLWLVQSLSVLCLFVVVFPGLSSVHAQQAHPGFTIVEQTTYYDVNGEALSGRKATRYYSAGGDWRYVGKLGDYESATVYRRGIGVYQSNSRFGRLVKVSCQAPGCGSTTAEELLRDAKFKRTEMVLGLNAYVLSERLTGVGKMETFFVPELGRIPFKRVYTFDNGSKLVEEPISIEFGEPTPADLYGPDYLVIEQIPIFDKELAKQLLSRPDPIYPDEILARGISETVFVSVVVDETGSVIFAQSNSPIPRLNAAAMEAASKTQFLPTFKQGQPVMVSGALRYQFAPASAREK